MVLIEPPLILTVPLVSVVTLVNAVVAPTAAPKVVTPELLMVRVKAPSTVFAKLIALEPPVLVSVVFALNVTAPL